MTTVTLSERQVRALALLARYHPQLGTQYPCGEGDYLTGEEMADLDRRFQDVLNPLVPGPARITT